MRQLLGWVGITLFLAASTGCTSIESWIEGRQAFDAGHGKTYAQAHCSSCHAVGGKGVSPNLDATRFVQMRFTYTPAGLARELEVIGEVGHYGMPPTVISMQDRQNLVAYIEDLKGGTAP